MAVDRSVRLEPTDPIKTSAKGNYDYKIWQVIGASAVGTMIEWYDFYIFGSLATVISPLFYPQGNDTLALIAYLSTFAVGFVVRPFGALFSDGSGISSDVSMRSLSLC